MVDLQEIDFQYYYAIKAMDEADIKEVLSCEYDSIERYLPYANSDHVYVAKTIVEACIFSKETEFAIKHRKGIDIILNNMSLALLSSDPFIRELAKYVNTNKEHL